MTDWQILANFFSSFVIAGLDPLLCGNPGPRDDCAVFHPAVQVMAELLSAQVFYAPDQFRVDLPGCR